MAKVSKNDIVNMSQDWGYDSSTGLPYSGRAVQKFIKEQFGTKMGYFFYDTSGNRYLVFASEESKDEYLANPTKTELILGSFDAPFNYEAEINLLSDSYVAVPLGTTGNVIEFTFKTKNKSGDEIPEDVVCTYTIVRGSMKKKVSQRYRSGQHVRFNVDKYLSEGANRITIGIVGQTTFAATTTGVTYQVANLTLTDNLDIAKLYNLTEGEQVMEIPFTLSGTGAKTMEWYLNGTMLPFDKNVDEVVDSSSSRVKYITLSGLARGVNKVEYRAYTLIEGEKFYSKTLHRDIIVENYDLQDGSAIIAMAYEKKNLDSTGIDIEQYIAYDLRFAIHNPQNTAATPVEVYVGGNMMATVNTENGIENSYSILLNETGTKELKVVAAGTEYTIQAEVSETSMSVREITEGLELGFSAVGRNNSMSNKNKWEDNNYTGTLSGFSFTQTSGWVNNRLLMQSGSKITFNYAPLASESTSTGKTLEFEFASSNVSDDNTVLCDLRNESGTGILITASEASITSRGGTKLSVKYKPEENTRISFVINRATGVTNKGLVFIYVDGIISGATNFGSSDDFKSDKMLEFAGVEGSEILLKQVRTYTSALSSDQILNNFTLYRDTTAEMLEVYNRNNIYEEDSQNFSVDTLQGQLPVMIVTGDIPTLENTTNKDTQITVDIEYYNLQDNEKSFVMKNAAMRPQGTSSMLYPKKNFRIYTQKIENTELYDGNGNLVQNKLYAFKEGSQPVNCWCLKADYAESSGTHNTGIAKLWHEVLYNSTINGEFVFRTEAQKKALESGYPYDVRTTIDGFPILMFYRESENDDLIFIGKYNFNNDKSTESVFGFTGIPNFDNSHMQCWEILNNGDALALFTNVSDFDSRWADAFESRYPDTKTPNTADLKAFSVWLNSMNGNAEAFATEKWEHMNVYMMAAYYVYLMRFGAVDQTVKNAMLTSEDGQKFYFINYDNDTINGLRNNGVLVFDPTIDRQSLDPETGGLAYAYAGHDSVLWNMLEGDTEFMQIVKDVDNALYANGLSYDRVIQVFNEQQADQWNERIYNQDAQYKYISPYTDSSLNNLEMLQGKRQSHRMWWLSRRFSLYDSKFVSGDFKGKALEFKVINNTEAGWTFGIEAGTDMEYGYGVYNPIETGVALQKGETHNFTITQTLNIGDPVRIYSAVNLQGVDLSNILPRLSNVELNNVYNDAMGTRLKKLVLGNGLEENTVLSSISSIAKAKRLESLDIRGCKGIITLDLSGNIYFKTLRAMNSGLTSVEFAKGAPITRLELPNTLQTLRLEQLVSLAPSGLVVEDNGANILSYNVLNCPLLSSDINTVFSWFNHKTAEDRECTLYMDNVNWVDVTPEDFLKICTAKTNGMNITLRGRVKLTTSSQEIIDAITAAFGSLVFKPTNELYINAPDAIYLAGPSEILEGQSAQFTAAVFTENYGTVTYSISSGSRTGVTINAQTGYLTSVENGNSDSTLTIRAMHRPTTGSSVYVEKQLKIKKRIYPSSITINGSTRLNNEQETYTWSSSTTGITGDFRVEWELTGDILEYANIETFNKERCIIRKTQDAIEEVTGVLTVKIIKNVNGSTVSSATKTVLCLNPDILMTKTSNPEVMSVMWQAGLCANENYMTKTEAGAVTDIDLQPGTSSSTSIFCKYGSSIKTFDEFEYFTLLENIPNYCFYYCSSLNSIKLPNQVKSIKQRAFYYCKLVSIHIPDSVINIGSEAFRNNSSLTHIYGAKNVESIHHESFTGCSKVGFIEETATFGLYRQTSGVTMEMIATNTFFDDGLYAILFGDVTFGIVESFSFFDKMSNSITLNLGYTGSIEDLKDRLDFKYNTIEISSNFQDAEFEVAYTSSYGGYKTVRKTVGRSVLDVSLGSTITIRATEIIGTSFEELNITAKAFTSIEANFLEHVKVGIAHKNGTFYTTEEWTSGGYSNDDAEGVCVLRALSGSLIIAKENASDIKLRRGGVGKGLGIEVSSKKAAAFKYDGYKNTQLIIEQCQGYTDSQGTVGAPAAEACTSYVFASGNNGYLPSFGELQSIYDNKSAVNSALLLIGGSALLLDYYWTSTNVGTTNRYEIDLSTGNQYGYSDTNSTFNVRACSSHILKISSSLYTIFTVSYINNDDRQVTERVKADIYSMNVKVGTQVTVTPDAVGNMVAEPQTFTWTGFRHECSFAFAKDAGVYIQHVNGSLYTESEWTAGGYANSDANGVALLSDTYAFVISKTDADASGLMWGGYHKEIPNVIKTSTTSTAITDIDGAGNTPKIINYLAGTNDGYVDGAPAAEACVAYTFPSGVKGYLPALGEWKIACDNKDAVVTAMSLIGGKAIGDHNYWSSTQYYSSSSWHIYWTNGYMHSTNRNVVAHVRAFTTI